MSSNQIGTLNCIELPEKNNPIYSFLNINDFKEYNKKVDQK